MAKNRRRGRGKGTRKEAMRAVGVLPPRKRTSETTSHDQYWFDDLSPMLLLAEAIQRGRVNAQDARQQMHRNRTMAIFGCIYCMCYSFMYLVSGTRPYTDAMMTPFPDNDNRWQLLLFLLIVSLKPLFSSIPVIAVASLITYFCQRRLSYERSSQEINLQALSQIVDLNRKHLAEIKHSSGVLRQRANVQLKVRVSFIAVMLLIYMFANRLDKDAAWMLLPLFACKSLFFFKKRHEDNLMLQGTFDQREALAFAEKTRDGLKIEEFTYSDRDDTDAPFRTYKLCFQFLSGSQGVNRHVAEVLYESFADWLRRELGVFIIYTSHRDITFSWNARHSKVEIDRIGDESKEKIALYKKQFQHVSNIYYHLREIITSNLPARLEHKNEERGFCFAVDIGRFSNSTLSGIKASLLNALQSVLQKRYRLNKAELIIANLETLCVQEAQEVSDILNQAHAQAMEYCSREVPKAYVQNPGGSADDSDVSDDDIRPMERPLSSDNTALRFMRSFDVFNWLPASRAEPESNAQFVHFEGSDLTYFFNRNNPEGIKMLSGNSIIRDHYIAVFNAEKVPLEYRERFINAFNGRVKKGHSDHGMVWDHTGRFQGKPPSKKNIIIRPLFILKPHGVEGHVLGFLRDEGRAIINGEKKVYRLIDFCVYATGIHGKGKGPDKTYAINWTKPDAINVAAIEDIPGPSA